MRQEDVNWVSGAEGKVVNDGDDTEASSYDPSMRVSNKLSRLGPTTRLGCFGPRKEPQMLFGG